jgi:hypothetical protein
MQLKIPFFVLTMKSSLIFVKGSYFLFHKSYCHYELASQMFGNTKTLMVACNPRKGKYLTASGVFRGGMSTKDFDHHDRPPN